MKQAGAGGRVPGMESVVGHAAAGKTSAVANSGEGTGAGSGGRAGIANPQRAEVRGGWEALDACVHCGFCLPACPTYVVTGDEADSPRGRILLMRALEHGEIASDDEALREHLDACLGCRGCEPVCPSGVEYGRGLETARNLLVRERGLGFMGRAVLALFAREWAWRPAFVVGRWVRGWADGRVGGWAGGHGRIGGQAGGHGRIGGWAEGHGRIGGREDGRMGAETDARGTGATDRLMGALRMLAATRPAPVLDRPAAPAATGNPAARPIAPAHPPIRHTATRPPVRQSPATLPPIPQPAHPPVRPPAVLLFRGCVMDTLFGHVHAATRRVLEANGYEIVDAPGQTCCGALHAHAGDHHTAQRLAAQNVRSLADRADFIVVNSAGCGALLKDYGALLGAGAGADVTAARVAAKVRDVSELLAAMGPRPGAALDLDVAYDAPCHLQHAQRVHAEPLAVLGAIPSLRVQLLPGSSMCCGSAGVYSLLEPAMSQRVLDAKISEIAAAVPQPALIVSGNPGCLMQIGAVLSAAGLDIRVAHPVELLDASYRAAGFYR